MSSNAAGYPITRRSALNSRSIPRQLDDLRRGLAGGPAIEGRLRVVLDGQLDRLRDVLAGDARGQGERHVDSRRHAGGGDHLALLDDPPADRGGTELSE